MPRNFFALCQTDDGLVPKRIRVTAGVQGKLEELFDGQEEAFLQGKDEEIAFDGGWKPDNNELLTIDDAALAQPLVATIENNVTTFEELNIAVPGATHIKAVFTVSADDESRFLVQRFMSSQYLQKTGFAVILKNDQYTELSEPGFSLDNRLACIVDVTVIKFASFFNVRTIFALQHHYIEATNAEVDAFAGHGLFQVDDVDQFKGQMDQTSRKLIRGIAGSGVLGDFTADQIKDRADQLNLGLAIQDGKIVMPNEKKDVKALLRFLENSVYSGPFSGATYITNSKRRL